MAMQLKGHADPAAVPGFEALLGDAMAEWSSTDHEALEVWLAASPYYEPGREDSFLKLHRPQLLGALREAGLASKPPSIAGPLAHMQESSSSRMQQHAAALPHAIGIGMRSYESSLAASVAASVFDDDMASQVSSTVGRVGLPHLTHQVLRQRAMLGIQPESKLPDGLPSCDRADVLLLLHVLALPCITQYDCLCDTTTAFCMLPRCPTTASMLQHDPQLPTSSECRCRSLTALWFDPLQSCQTTPHAAEHHPQSCGMCP
jgi:hypothetical protein